MKPGGNPSWKPLFLYARYCWRYKPLAIGSLGFSLMLALELTVLPFLVARALGQLIKHGTVSSELIIVTVVSQLAIAGLSYVLDARCIAIMHSKVASDLYNDSFAYLTRQDYSFFANRFSGSIVTQASRFAKVFTTFNDTVFFEMLPQLLAVCIAIGVIGYHNIWFGLVTLIFWLGATALVVLFGLKRLPMRRSAVAKESQQIGELADVMSNALTVKMFAAESRENRRYRLLDAARSVLFLQSWHRAIRNGWIVRSLCALLQIGVFVGGIWAVKHGEISIATFLLFQVYVLQIIKTIDRSSMIVRHLEAISGDAQEMAELLEQPPLIQDKPDAEPVTITKGAIDFKQVGFQYEERSGQTDLFEQFSVHIKAGEKIGLVGPSGGGKTTITRLLLRFIDIDTGSISIDGHDLRDLRQADLRRAIWYVPQEPLLFHRSIKENIRYGRPDATDAEIIAVAKKAYAHKFISGLADGYDTIVGERGVKLSGGQRQRVAIARAMLSDAPILVLDEATSALDSESERLIQKALQSLMQSKTTLVIAHRLSTIQRMDRIIVLDNGQIREQGTHTQLLDAGGLYAKLWSHQSGGFLED